MRHTYIHTVSLVEIADAESFLALTYHHCAIIERAGSNAVVSASSTGA